MAGHTRLTLVGSGRRVDVVLPDDEPVGRLLPEALRLTGEESADPAAVRRLALLDGRLLEPDDTLEAADVADGAVVRVVALAEAPHRRSSSTSPRRRLAPWPAGPAAGVSCPAGGRPRRRPSSPRSPPSPWPPSAATRTAS